MELDLKKFLDKFEEYVSDCLSNDRVMTIPALCVVLGISVQRLKKMEQWDLYRETIQYIKTVVEADLSQRGLMGKCESSAVNLQLKHNHNYIERTEQNVNVKNDININVMSLEEIQEKIKENEMLEMKLKAKLVSPN